MPRTKILMSKKCEQCQIIYSVRHASEFERSKFCSKKCMWDYRKETAARATERQCTVCSETKSLDDFQKTKNNLIGVESFCKQCRRVKEKTYIANNKEKVYERMYKKRAENRRALKNEILDAYGNKCVCCGETEPDFLTIDHINGNGNQHRREIGNAGYKVYYWLKKQGFPKDNFQLLCYNCNCSKGKWGECVHKLQRS